MSTSATEHAGAQAPAMAEDEIKGPSNLEVLGEMCWLYSQSRIHRTWAIGSLQQWLLPAILTRQMRVYRRNGKPYAFVTWAWLSQEVEEAYVLNTASLQPKDWKSGSRGWILDWVAPFGGTREIARDLKQTVFPNDVGRFLRVKEGSDTLRIVYVHGSKAIDKARNRELNPTVNLRRPAPGPLP